MPITSTLFVLRHKETQKYVCYDKEDCICWLDQDICFAFFFNERTNTLIKRMTDKTWWDAYKLPARFEFELVELTISVVGVTT